MTHLLGNELSDNAYSILSTSHASRKNLVIILLTVDESGFSRVCLLSPFQVAATEKSVVYFEVYPNSHTKQNLDRTRKATLIVPDDGGLLYASGEVEALDQKKKEGMSTSSSMHDSQSVYLMKLGSVSLDKSSEAPIVSEMTFETKIIGPEYQKNFETLLETTKKHKS